MPKQQAKFRVRPARRMVAAALGIVTAGAAVGACSSSSSSGPPTLNWYMGAQGGGWIENAIAACNKQAAGAYKIKFQELPARATDQREQLVRRLAANDSSIDIIGMDVIWTAEFANARWITPFPESDRAGLTNGVLKGPVSSGTFQGKLYAAPFTSNSQLLWYRKDLVSNPPKTWAALIKQASDKNLKFQIQGTKAESMTVTFNALLASAGGTMLENAGAGKNATVSLAQQPTMEAMQVLHDLATSKAADPELNTANEDSSRQAFEKGNSLFEVNYPFIYPSAADAKVNGKSLQSQLGWARFPEVVAGKPSKPPLGGFNLGIGAQSKHQALDIRAIKCIRQPANQRFAAINGGNPPTLDALYNEPSLIKVYPFAAVLRSSINDAEPRPVSPAYNDLSLAVQDTLSPFSSMNPQSDPSSLRTLMQQALKSEAVL
jgi:multiple sugar transport system substrate-binding protein